LKEHGGKVPPLLSVERLNKYFAGLAALKDVSFEVQEGQICGLIGPNGAGKTTLFSIIGGSVSPSSGTIRYSGKDVTRWKSFQAVRAGVARTHQITRPFREMTARQNVEVGLHFGRGPVSRSPSNEVTAILEGVGLGHVAGRNAAPLCVGDQRRLELARTLAAKPKLLLCDEVCSGLTETEMNEVLELLRRIRERGATILYVEHNMRAIMSTCDQVLVLNFGQKLTEGPPLKIQNDPAVIEAYLGRTAAN
jgi:branched-chain amino acid transport system ATP-binding protein